MKFLFIDESEKQKNSDHRYFFCLCGLMVDKDYLLSLENNLKEVKNKHGLLNLKDSRGKSQVKKEITNELCKVLESHNAKIISTILGDIALRDIQNAADTYFDALFFLIERFFLNLKSDKKTGIIIFDSMDKKLEKKIKEKFSEFISKEEHKIYNRKDGYYKEKIYPSLLFSNDEYSSILQATDLIATSLNSAIWNNIQTDNLSIEDLPNYNEYLKIYWPLFVKNQNGKVSGWGIKIWR